jgi:hypothetical protein
MREGHKSKAIICRRFERLDHLDSHNLDETLVSRMSLATTLASSGQHEEAIKIQREVAQILGRYADEHPRMPNVLHDLAVTLNITNQLGEARA